MGGGLLLRQPATICRLNRTNPLPHSDMRPVVLLPSMHGGCNLAITRWRHQWAVSASKGFGSSTTRERADDDTPTDKPRRRMRRQSQTLPSQQERDALSGKFQVDVQKSLADEQEAKEFAERLKALKAQGSDARGRTPAADTAPTAPSAGPIAAFDAPVESIYDNPPSLQATMLSSLNSDISDPKLKNAQFGPSQVGIAVSAVVFGLVFVLVAGGDFAPNNRFKGVRPAQGTPDTIQQGIINTRISDLQQKLEQAPGDMEAMQALAFSYAQLQQFDKAANLMDKVVARQPNSADAWRLLGETSLLGEQAQRSVKAYEKAVALRNNDLQIATGMVDAYIANGQPAKAVAYLEELRARAPLVSALGVVAKDAPAGTAAPAEAATPAADGASQQAPAAAAAEVETAAAVEAAASSSSSSSTTSSSSSSRVILERPPLRPLEPVAIELLLGKTYSVWRGHDNDAIATYDNVIARFQEDFRGYLAKGVFLRDKGRRADAERMFLQARFYAPENRQRFVREQSETKPIVELPDN